MADSAFSSAGPAGSAPHLALDADDDIFDADGNPESATNPETGEVVRAEDPALVPSSVREEIDADERANRFASGQREDDENEERAQAGLSDVLADTLAVYGLESDAIEWNGEETRVRDLSPEDRREFLTELRDSAIREAAGTTPDEQELLDFMRQGGNLRELFASEQGANAGGPSSIGALSADEVNLADIRQQYPTLSDEEVQEELADRKLSARYENKTGQIRERLTSQEQQVYEGQRATAQAEERQEIVSAANQLTSVLDFPVEGAVRDYLIARVADVQDDGQTAFMASLTPEKALRLEFLDTYMSQIDAHYKGVEAAAYKRGRTSALSGAPSSPGQRSGSAGNQPAAGRGSAAAQRDERQYEDFTLGD